MYHILLCISLVALLFFGYLLLKKELATPALLFIFGMCICALNLLNFTSVWNVYLHQNTYILVIGGCLSLMLGSLFYNSKHKCTLFGKNKSFKFVPLRTKTLKMLFIFQLAINMLRIYFLNNFYGAGNLAANLVAHTLALKYDGDVMTYPKGIGLLIGAADFLGYFYAFLLPIYFYQNKQYKSQRLWLMINFSTCLVTSLLTSGRTQMLHLLITLGSFYLITLWRNKKSLNTKRISIWALASLLFLSGFQQLGFLIGREKTDETALDIAGVYCGAQLQNLDDYINGNYQLNTRHFGETSFYIFYKEYALVIGIPQTKLHPHDYHLFNERKGRGLGNVGTAFQEYYIDFGFVGTFILCFIIGWFMQFFHLKISRGKDFDTGIVSVGTFLYATIIASMFMSFFSESFFNKSLNHILNYRYWLAYIFLFYLLYRKLPWKYNTKNKDNE